MADTSLSLLERLRDQAAPADWDRLVRLYAPLLRHWLARQPLQGADADDLLQDVPKSCGVAPVESQKRLPGISRKYKYGVCVFKNSFPISPEI
jgi:RNA polymerase sigma-70 factor, ECF subfamily